MNPVLLLILILFLPLTGSLLMPLAINRGHISGVLGSIMVGISTLLAIYTFLFFQFPIVGEVAWFNLSGGLYNITANVGVSADYDMILTLVVVSFIATMVHVFSISYMAHDESKRRYFGYLGLFTFSMYGIILSANLLQLFIFWELVGLSSYLLIGFWYQREKAANAGKKAFLVNRVADSAFLLGLIMIWVGAGTLDFMSLQTQLNNNEVMGDSPWFWIGGLLVFIGAIGKSAQFPFHVWLPDAMEGPTPVSALLHAATMVAAGVILLLKMFPILHPEVLTIIAFTGGVTTVVGAFAAMMQYDIKKILAYSTVSQLGYMMVGIGVGANNGALFHLVTHAFFKAGLFLSAGVIIHGFQQITGQGINDIRLMGGVRQRMPGLFALMALFSAALAGLPFFSGFLSKDAILVSATQWASASGGINWLVPAMGFVVVLLTAFYMLRLILVVFFGEPRSEAVNHLYFRELLLRVPLSILALGSIFFFYSWNPLDYSGSWLFRSIGLTPNFWLGPGMASHSLLIPAISIGLAASGLLLGFAAYRPTGRGLAVMIAGEDFKNSLFRLGYHNFYLDSLYDYVIVRPLLTLARLADLIDRRLLDGLLHLLSRGYVVLAAMAGWFDRHIIDGLVEGLALLARIAGRIFSGIQTGKVQSYIFAAVLSILLLIWLIT